jgi:hypothetical protein
VSPAAAPAPAATAPAATGALAHVPAVASVVVAVVVGSDKAVGLAFWSLVLAVLASLEVAARRARGPGRPPSLGELVARYLARPAWRAASVAVWLYAGWHLFSH